MFKFFTSDLRRNLTKIFCLSLGMAIGFLLVAKIYFQKTYDIFLPDSEQIYVVNESVTQNGEYREYPSTPGAIAPAMKRYVPQVEAATRATLAAGETRIVTDDGRSVNVDGIMFADSCYFDVLKTEIVAGNPHEVLEVVDQCMVPKSLADKLGGDVVGLQVSVPNWSGYKATIGGVYEDFPLNSSIKNVVYISLSTLPKFSGDGRENWVGNDRYKSYVKLAKDAKPEETRPSIKKMLEENVDRETIEVWHFDMHLRPLIGLNNSLDGTKLIVLLAIIILLSAGINYLLITIGQMGKRSKEMAIRKCYGTSNAKLFRRVLLESLFPLLISVGLAFLIDSLLSEFCRKLLGFTPAELFSTKHLWIVELTVCLVLYFLTGVIPAWIYCKTPVAHAFRGNVRSRRAWKLAMLAVQFFASGMILCLLVLVVRQYRMIGNLDMGFDYKNIGVVELWGVSPEKATTVVNELKKLGCVEGVATSYSEFSEHASGNNVWKDGYEENQFNVADLYNANPEIFDVMGIKFILGETFHENADSTTYEVIVEERMIDFLKKNLGVTDDNIVGTTIRITEHSYGDMEFTICGVIENMRRDGFEEEHADKRAAVLFPSSSNIGYTYIRFKDMNHQNMQLAQGVVNDVLGVGERYVYPYSDKINLLMEPTKRFGQAVMVVGIAIFVISLIGLIGYTSDEVQRRRKEIAIRKVSGTPDAKILRLFCTDILKVAFPSLALGGIVSLIAGSEWLSRFTDKVSLAPEVTVLCVVLLAMIVSLVVTLNIMKAVRTNPVEYLREE